MTTATTAATSNKKSVSATFLSKDETAKYDQLTSIAAKIRYLKSLAKTTGDISRYMTEKENKLVRYQWVRNVLNQPLKTQ
jgi:purine-cytosine permease-like protein